MRHPIHENLKLPEKNTALLIVDVQEEQRSDPDYYAHDFEQVLANCSALLETARASGLAVGHAQYVRDFSVEPPRPFEVTTPEGDAVFSDRNSGQVDICREATPIPGEPVFVKNDASSFKGTGLADWLNSNHMEWLIVCGVWTEACVAATVRDAISEGFRVLLVKDACGSGSTLMHQTAILNLANRLFGGGVCDTVRARELISGNDASLWRLVDTTPLRFTEENISQLYESL